MNWYSWIGSYFKNNEKRFFQGEIINGLVSYNNYAATKEKLEIILKNFALLRVFSLQCDLFSMASFYVKDVKTGEYILDDPFLKYIKQPNPFEGQADFLWSFMFNHMMGSGNIWGTSKIIENPLLRLYVLDNWKIEVDDNICGFDKLLESDAAVKEYFSKTIAYNYNDGTDKQLKLSDIISIKDLNVANDWVGFQSRIDSLYKIISNIEAALDSENINIRYSGKFIVAGQADPNDTTKLPLSEIEKNDVETKMNGKKSVHAM